MSTLELGLAIINCDYKTTEGSTQFTASKSCECECLQNTTFSFIAQTTNPHWHGVDPPAAAALSTSLPTAKLVGHPSSVAGAC